MTNETNWLQQCLDRLPQARVTVFGDFCLDAYWLIDTSEGEISIETNLPVRRVRRQRYSLGGAGNVVANLVDIGVGKVRAVGLIGDDMFGRAMLDMLTTATVNAGGMLHDQADWQTMVYAKPCIGQAEQNRIDFGAFNAVWPATLDALAASLSQAAAQSDVVILNQQVPAGVCTSEMIGRINKIIAANPQCRFIVDSRHRAGEFRGAILKLNAHEAARLCGAPRPLDERIGQTDACELARTLCGRTGQDVFITRGENGLLAASGGKVEVVPGIQVLGRTDPVGAGDTAVSALAAVLGSGGDALAAARLANIAASITVQKLQTTGTASPDEIRRVGPSPDYVYQPELADDPRQARRCQDSEIEIVRDLPAGLAIRHAVFDHDGTISTLREGWEGIMAPMMVRAILGGRHDHADEGLYGKVVEHVHRFIDRTTGMQTLVQMQGLVELVRQFGLVDQADILDMHGYKALFDRELAATVQRRLAKLRRGELAAGDFQIAGAAAFVARLHAMGVKLYLASGTDVSHVAAEAQALGYAAYFEGRIFGAVGDVAVEAKRLVLERIFREHKLAGPQVAAFGDGPVEIRETRKCDGVAIGIASDELRRFGPNSLKRSRLIRAGADLVVPDFSQGDAMLKLLKLPTA